MFVGVIKRQQHCFLFAQLRTELYEQTIPHCEITINPVTYSTTVFTYEFIIIAWLSLYKTAGYYYSNCPFGADVLCKPAYFQNT